MKSTSRLISLVVVLFLVALSLNFVSGAFYNNCEGEDCCKDYFAGSRRVIMNYAPISGGYFQPYNVAIGNDLITVNIYQTGVASPSGWADVVNYYCNQTLVDYFDNDTDDDGYDNQTDCDDFDDTKWRSVDLYLDSDGDGFGNSTLSSIEVCIGSDIPSGYSDNTEDCNDFDADVRPGASEVCGDGIDNNCDGIVDEGCDGGNETNYTMEGVSNLFVRINETDYIGIQWDNPDNFNKILLHKNGANVANLSNGNSYDFMNLTSNTTYELGVQILFNGNYSDIETVIGKTLVNGSQDGDEDGDDDDGDGDRRSRRNTNDDYGNDELDMYYRNLLGGGSYYNYGNDTIVLAPVDEDISGFNWGLFWIIVAILVLVVLIGVLIFLILREL